MILKSLEVENFRKFREPLRIDGFTDGLNIVCWFPRRTEPVRQIISIEN